MMKAEIAPQAKALLQIPFAPMPKPKEPVWLLAAFIFILKITAIEQHVDFKLSSIASENTQQGDVTDGSLLVGEGVSKKNDPFMMKCQAP